MSFIKLPSLLFLCFFQSIIIFFAIKVIINKNPLYSLLYLILVFTMSSIFLFFKGIEFLALLLILVYVGAIIILFIFVIKIFNLKFLKEDINFFNFLVKNFICAIIFFIFNITILDNISSNLNNNFQQLLFKYNFYAFNIFDVDNLCLIFLEYIVIFLMITLILLVTMIGSIALILQSEKFFNFNTAY